MRRVFALGFLLSLGGCVVESGLGSATLHEGGILHAVDVAVDWGLSGARLRDYDDADVVCWGANSNGPTRPSRDVDPLRSV